jgi:phage baseplate assembly protein W
MPTISPLLPLSRDDRFGVSAHTSIVENAKQNLKNLILTNPGERIDPNYGVGLKRYIFENITDDTLDNIKNSILSQIKKYLPYISVSKIEVTPSNISDNGIVINIRFSVSGSAATIFTVSV